MSWDQDITARLQRAAASERADERHRPADTMLEAASTIDLLRTQHQGQAEHIIALRAEVDRLAALAPVVAREVARAKAEALREAADALAGGEILDDERWFASRMGEEGEANWLYARADALDTEAAEAVAKAMRDTEVGGSCPTPGCRGDVRYSSPGRGHEANCHYPRPTEAGGS